MSGLSPEEQSARIKEGKRRAAEKRRMDAELAAAQQESPENQSPDLISGAVISDSPSEPDEDEDEDEPEDDEDEPEEEAPPPSNPLRTRTLEGIDPEVAALFTDEELAKYEEEESAKAAAERKKRALEDIRANLRQKARVSHNLIAASVLRSDAEKKRLAELVSFRVDMPGNGAGHRGRNGIRIDGFLYSQGQVYTRPRAVFETLQSIFYKAWLQELTFSQLNQSQPGMSPAEVLARQIPRFEVPRPPDNEAA